MMQKRLRYYFVILFLLISEANIAQITFKKNYNAAGDQTFDLFALDDHNFFGALGYGSGIAKLDSLGNFMYQHTYANDTFLPLRRLVKHSANLYYFASNYYRDSCAGFPNYYPVIGKMDSLGNILSSNYYHVNLDCHNLAGGFDITNDAGAIMGGSSA